MSASSSFLRLILSLRPSASRLAAVILACICSPLISADILTDCAPGELECQSKDVTEMKLVEKRSRGQEGDVVELRLRKRPKVWTGGLEGRALRKHRGRDG